MARRFATLDVLSQERVIAGLGIGWSKDEYEVSGVPFEHRRQRANEFLQMLKRIWTDEVVEFKGKFYSIPASKIGPNLCRNLILQYCLPDLVPRHSYE